MSSHAFITLFTTTPPDSPGAAYKPSHRTVLLLNTILIVMLAVSLGAVVGSVRNIIVSWKDFELFG